MNFKFSSSSFIRAFFGELIGTYVLVVIGNGVIAQSQLTSGAKVDYLTINWGWALGCALGIVISSDASGGHLNPAVTLALAIARDFSWKFLPVYWCAQYLGALAASATVFGVYYEAIVHDRLDGEFKVPKNASQPGATAIFSTYPAYYTSLGTGLAEEILSSMIFMLVICVTSDKKQSKVNDLIRAVVVGLTLMAFGLAYGSNGGYALNPARDLAPRIISFLAGWGLGTFSFRGFNWFWIYLVGPHVGAILGVGIYHLFLKTNESAERRVKFKNEKEEEPQWWERSNIEFAPQKNLQSLNPYVFREYPLNIDEHF